MNTRILFVGGGTGGHFYPLIAVAESCNSLEERPRLFFAGPNPYDYDALISENIAYLKIPAGKRRRYHSFLNFVDFFKTVYGCFVAVLKLYYVYPDVIMSKGGYTSVPVVLAARFLRIPVVIHESDSVMGTANKLGLKSAHTVVTNYSELSVVLKHPRVQILGIPTRRIVRAPANPENRKKLALVGDRPLILIIGGSQGAERINLLILDALDELLPTYEILHQTGNEHYENCKLAAEKLIPDKTLAAHYHVVPFLNAALLNEAYHAAAIIVSRAGSTSIYEIALHAKPSILIPIPEEVSHDQRTNAYTYARISGASVLEEGNITPGLLHSEIERIMMNEALRTKMSDGARTFGKEDAEEKVRDLLLAVAQEHYS